MTNPFDPFDQFSRYSRMTQDSIARMQAFYDELAKLELKAYEAAKKNADHLGQMLSDTMDYATAMTAEWRKMSIEAVRKGTDAVKAQTV